jgi:hypothetical protein
MHPDVDRDGGRQDDHRILRSVDLDAVAVGDPEPLAPAR